jgi:hypothetical protein
MAQFPPLTSRGVLHRDTGPIIEPHRMRLLAGEDFIAARFGSSTCEGHAASQRFFNVSECRHDSRGRSSRGGFTRVMANHDVANCRASISRPDRLRSTLPDLDGTAATSHSSSSRSGRCEWRVQQGSSRRDSLRQRLRLPQKRTHRHSSATLQRKTDERSA